MTFKELKTTTKNKRVGIRLTDQEYKDLVELVKKEGCSLTDYLVKRVKPQDTKQFDIAMFNLVNLIGFGCKESFQEPIMKWVEKIKKLYEEK